MTKHVAQRS